MHRNSLKYSNDQRGKTRLQFTQFLLKILQMVTHRITRHYSAELQTAKQTRTLQKHSIKFTDSDFPCHLKVNRDKLALLSCLWKCENCERLTFTVNSFTKIDRLDGFRPLRQSGWENSARFRNQSDYRIQYAANQNFFGPSVHINYGKSTMYIQIPSNKNLGICHTRT